ncbi:hypothetical protein EJB05_19052, partial [Eragrostis curvula]
MIRARRTRSSLPSCSGVKSIFSLLKKASFSDILGNRKFDELVVSDAIPSEGVASATPSGDLQSSSQPLALVDQSHALVNPGFISSGTDWKIKEEMDRIKLWFDMEKLANKDKLKVDKDKDVLVIKYEDSSSGIPASSLDARILMPNDYKQAEVQTDIEFGVLLVTILKPKPKST